MGVKGQISVNEQDILVVDADPSTAGGVVAKIGSLAMKESAPSGLWQKTGANDIDWTKVASGGAVPKLKSGIVSAGSFTGSPRKSTVTFSSAFSSANYSVGVIGISDGRDWTVESVVGGSFVINANAAAALTGSVYWTAVEHGEP